jgi:hypothetical protein
MMSGPIAAGSSVASAASGLAILATTTMALKRQVPVPTSIHEAIN